MYGLLSLLAVVGWVALARAHTVITYPGWRGNNLHTNGTLPELNPDSVGIDHYENGSTGFPFGMQWMYPCEYFSPVACERSGASLTSAQAAVCP